MSRVVIETAVTVPGVGTLKKGDVIEATAAQLAAISTAGGTTRAAMTATLRDVLGESFGYCPNSNL
jgi:hypothetical protein